MTKRFFFCVQQYLATVVKQARRMVRVTTALRRLGHVRASLAASRNDR